MSFCMGCYDTKRTSHFHPLFVPRIKNDHLHPLAETGEGGRMAIEREAAAPKVLPLTGRPLQPFLIRPWPCGVDPSICPL